jgi:hypothetical protein
MNVVVRRELGDIRPRLAELGLDEESLKETVRRGQLAFISCTANHPPQFPGMAAWAETVRALREYVVPLGWRRSNDNNYALAVDSEGSVAIAVATGNDGTGRADVTPSTNARKGPSTLEAITVNQLQFGFMDDHPARLAPASDGNDHRMTWILLIHRAQNEVRSELSLPSSIAEDGHIDGWRERILLGSISFDADLVEIVPPPQPDITIDVRRRG